MLTLHRRWRAHDVACCSTAPLGSLRFAPLPPTLAAQALAPLTSDSRLRGVLSYIMLGCCGVGPDEGSFATLAGVTCHFLQGGAYPHGGAAAIVAAFVGTVEAAGGRAFVRAPVGSILLDASGRAVGVRMKRNDVEVRAPMVISTIGAQLTLEGLLPTPTPAALPGLAAAREQLAAARLTRELE